MAKFPHTVARRLVRLALQEDIGRGDITTTSVIPMAAVARATLLAKADGVIAGLPLLALVFGPLDRRIKIKLLAKDGDRCKPGQVMAELRGPAHALLTGERTALNFIQRLSGIATLTHQFVKRTMVAQASLPVNQRTKILDTRKTTPTLRALEKYAVASGGGTNHRIGLYDQILIKDNHLAVLRQSSSSSKSNFITAAIRAARVKHPRVTVEIECTTLAEAVEAAEAGGDIILLDNMTPAQIKKAIKLIVAANLIRGGIVGEQRNPRKSFAATKIEISGGITLANIGKYAAALRAATKTSRAPLQTAISIGALTHSAPALDLSLEVED